MIDMIKFSELLKESPRSAYKAIMNQDGRKVNGERKGKMLLALVDEEGYVKNVTWKDFKASKLPWSVTQKADDGARKKAFVAALLSQEKNFGKQVDFNRWANEHKSAKFEERVDMVFKMTSAKYPKSGLKG